MTSGTLLSLQRATLDNTVGALFLGVLGAMFLFGITTLQTYWYYHLYPKDSLLHKFSVTILWILDALHLALTIHAVYTYIVPGFGDRVGLNHILWSVKLQVSVNVVIILMVHCLYALRVWILGEYHRGIVGYFVAFVVAGGFAVGIVLAFHTYKIHTFTELESISWVVITALSTSSAIDFVITAAMSYYLWKIQAPASRLNATISNIIQYTLGSGLFTSACSLSALFTYVLLPNTFIFLGLEFLLTKLYFLSFLTMLNARKRTNTTSTPGTNNGIFSDLNQSKTPVTDLVPRRYRTKTQWSFSFGSNSSTQTQGHVHVHQHRLRPATSSFWSPPPPPTLLDEEQGYQDFLPPNLESEQGCTTSDDCVRSLSDGSETIRGTVRGGGGGGGPLLSPVSPTSTSALLRSPVQRPASIYEIEAPTSPSFRTSTEVRPLSTSYPWHAR